jgi:hypothetical protein
VDVGEAVAGIVATVEAEVVVSTAMELACITKGGVSITAADDEE